MGSTAHATPEEIEEHFEPDDVVLEKSLLLAKWIQESKHAIAFTGAGISTSAGIADFRGPQGLHTLAAKGEARKEKSVSSLKAIPTTCHMSIVKMLETGHLKYLISQNTDGLHRKSGVPPAKISELHGNTCIENCVKCKREYLRDFRTRTALAVHEHITGRKCSDPKCGGDLADSIINFGENLPPEPLDKAFIHGERADLCLSLGSSLRVTPAADIPKIVAKRGKLIIVNLQTTPLDGMAALVIRARIDQVMHIVMQALLLDTPPFVLHRFFNVFLDFSSELMGNKCQIKIEGVDNNIPASIFRKVSVEFPGYPAVEMDREPFVLVKKCKPGNINLELFFMGNYNESTLKLSFPMPEKLEPVKKKFAMDFTVLERLMTCREI